VGGLQCGYDYRESIMQRNKCFSVIWNIYYANNPRDCQKSHSLIVGNATSS